jgi:hypothetical protein
MMNTWYNDVTTNWKILREDKKEQTMSKLYRVDYLSNEINDDSGTCSVSGQTIGRTQIELPEQRSPSVVIDKLVEVGELSLTKTEYDQMITDNEELIQGLYEDYTINIKSPSGHWLIALEPVRAYHTTEQAYSA